MKRLALRFLRGASTLPWLGARLVVLAEFLILSSRGGHDPERNGELELIRRAVSVRPADRTMVVFDVGANVGDWTALVLRVAGGAVDCHLFEPTRESSEALERRFGGDGRVRITRTALADRSGAAVMRAYGGTSKVNSLVDGQFHPGDSELEEVPMLTGDAYCRSRGIEAIDLLKIDTEGFEWNVLAGFEGMLREKRIRIIQFEYGYIHADTGHLMHHFFGLLEGYGYRVGPLRPRGPEFRSFHHTDNAFDSGPNYAAALPQVVPSLSLRRGRSLR